MACALTIPRYIADFPLQPTSRPPDIAVVLVGLGIAALFGNGPGVSMILGTCLALSSTAVVIEVLSSQGRLTTAVGRTSLSVLLAQDLAVVPILVFVTLLGGRADQSVLGSLFFALVNASVAIAAIVISGRLLLRPLFRLVTSVGASEVFVAAALFVIIGTGVAAALAGLSMALGAFIAGLLLAETEFRRAIETAVGPFKGLLLGLFFFTVGMSIDFREVLRDPVWLLAAAAAGCAPQWGTCSAGPHTPLSARRCVLSPAGRGLPR
jgi:CPA2 family monovalent cation:H+ antiporter-2